MQAQGDTVVVMKESLGLVGSPLLRKQVDFSVLKGTIVAPRPLHDRFLEALKIDTLPRGTSQPVTLVVEGREYSGLLQSVDVRTTTEQTLHLVVSQDLVQALRHRFASTHDYITQQREAARTGAGKRVRVKIPPRMIEHIEIYGATQPQRAALRLSCQNDGSAAMDYVLTPSGAKTAISRAKWDEMTARYPGGFFLVLVEGEGLFGKAYRLPSDRVFREVISRIGWQDGKQIYVKIQGESDSVYFLSSQDTSRRVRATEEHSVRLVLSGGQTYIEGLLEEGEQHERLLPTDDATAEALIQSLNERYRSPAEKERVVRAFERNSTLSHLIKQKRGYRCQICPPGSFPVFYTRLGVPYVETHHLEQVAHGGPDIEENLLVLCASCHRKFHYGTPAARAKRKGNDLVVELGGEVQIVKDYAARRRGP